MSKKRSARRLGADEQFEVVYEELNRIRHELAYGQGAKRKTSKRAPPKSKSRSRRTSAALKWLVQTSDGWLMAVTSSGTTISLPSHLAVNYLGTASGRDSFDVTEGINRGTRATIVAGNLSSTNLQHAISRSSFERRQGGPITVDGVVYDKQLTIRFGTTVVGPHPAKTDATNPVPSGAHEVEIPDYPHPCLPEYGELRTVWFRIGRSGDRYIHPGRVSAGCITCAPRYWPQIYEALSKARKNDAVNVGDLTVG